MDNQSIIQELTQKGFNFEESSLHARTLAIEKFRQYHESAEKYLLDAGVQDIRPLRNMVQEVTSDATLDYIQFYHRLLHEANPDKTLPLDAVSPNMNDLIGYGEIVASNLNERMLLILHEKRLWADNIPDAAYMEKLSAGFAVSQEE